MENVFVSDYSEAEDLSLVRRAQKGDGAALEALIVRHRQWIYNTALRMVGRPEDAEDVAQEILVKLITKLSTFRGESGFRTWLYRIVVNHILTMRRRPLERMCSSFDRQAALMDGLELCDDSAETRLSERETRAACLTGMLLCLDRSQRMAIVLSTLFNADSALGGELLETTPGNYRQILSRARTQLSGFMNDRCGLMNEPNPCRCRKKTAAAIKAGLVDPRKLRFDIRYVRLVRDFVSEKADLADTALESKLGRVLRDQPMYDPPFLARVFSIVLRRGEMGKFINHI